MSRELVLLLTLPALLTPQGMCVCQFVPIALTAAASRSAPTPDGFSADHAANAHPDCVCEACRSRATADSGGNGRHRSSPDGGPNAPVPPGKHWPGCPAAADAVPLAVTAPAVAVPTDFLAAADQLSPLAEAIPSNFRVSPRPAPAAPRPLFISHCALLI